MSEQQPFHDERQYARVQTRLSVRLRPVDEEDAERIRTELAERPSVWALPQEAALRERATRAAVDGETLMAQALLEISRQIVRLRARVLASSHGLQPGTVEELSGGGGRLSTPLELALGDRLELRFEDDDQGTPPVRALVGVVHVVPGTVHGYGFRYEAIHPWDQDRLIRMIYRLQRRALREVRSRED